MKKILMRYITSFLAMIALFFSLLTLVYMIPDTAIAGNAETSINVLEGEGYSPAPLFYVGAALLDNYTDSVMIDRNISSTDGLNPVEAAMYAKDYTRYWHGYQIYLRPLLTMFDYSQIRYLCSAVFLIGLCLTFASITKHIGRKVSMAFLITLFHVYPVIVSVSLQYISVFVIMFSACLYLMHFYRTSWLTDVPLFFMIVGMLTNFMDFLTAPLLTLGIPLLIFLFLELENGGDLFELFKKVISTSALWILGYGLCWTAKWLLASIILKTNVFQIALSQMVFRISGNESYPLNRIAMLKDNFKYMFFSQGTGICYSILVVLAILLLICFRRRMRYALQKCSLFVMIGLYPYIWYMILANHSEIHSYFTYRIQAITLFAIFLGIIYFIDWERIKTFWDNKFLGRIQKSE